METCHHCFCKHGTDDGAKQKCCHCGTEVNLMDMHVARVRKEIRSVDDTAEFLRSPWHREMSFDLSERTCARVWCETRIDDGKHLESVELLIDAQDDRDKSNYYTYVRFIVGPSKQDDLPFIRLRTPVEIHRWTVDGVETSMLPHPPCDGFY